MKRSKSIKHNISPIKVLRAPVRLVCLGVNFIALAALCLHPFTTLQAVLHAGTLMLTECRQK